MTTQACQQARWQIISKQESRMTWDHPVEEYASMPFPRTDPAAWTAEPRKRYHEERLRAQQSPGNPAASETSFTGRIDWVSSSTTPHG